jgi:hypothetical protein
MAARRIAAHASDPSVDGALLAWHEPGAPGVLVRDGAASRLGGVHPALGGGRLAVVRDGAIDVQATAGAPAAVSVAAVGADAVAVSASWVAWRAREATGDAIYAASLGGGAPARVAAAAELGHPALDGSLLAFHHPDRRGGRIVLVDLAAGTTRTIRRERRAQLLNPSLLGGTLLYVRASYRRQELRVGPVRQRAPRRDRRLWSTVPTGRRDSGHEPGKRHLRHGHPHKMWPRPHAGVATTLWTTALAADAAYVTRLRQRVGEPLVTEILRVPR